MNILIALDQIQTQSLLIEKGIEFATRMNASLSLLHVVPLLAPSEGENEEVIPSSGISTSSLSDTDFDDWKRKAQISETQLQKLVAEIRQAGIAVQGLHRLGQPGPVICDSAEQEQADVIMIGRRSENQRADSPLGSVSHFVIHHAPCSVWMFPNDD